MKKYTIKEITKAWNKFTKPIFIVDNKMVEVKDCKHGAIMFTDDLSNIKTLDIDYSKWITYLLSEDWRL